MAITNVARHIRQSDPDAPDSDAPVFDAFTASSVLAAAFCKDPTEVLCDLVQVEVHFPESRS